MIVKILSESPTLISTEKEQIIQQILKNRGVLEEDIPKFLNSDWDCVQSPFDLDYMEEAAEKILWHCRNSSDIAILVDCDCDGYTSAAFMFNYLEHQRVYGEVNDDGDSGTWCGNTPKLHCLMHEGKTHGLDDTDIMKELRDSVKPQLLIIPDASGTKEQYRALNDLGIDIVVIDHHETTERGDGAKVIVVNNQQSANYKNKALSGVGVVYQVCTVIDSMLTHQFADLWLDLVAVGMVADAMDLRSLETSFLVKEGLVPSRLRNPFLQQAVKDLSFSIGGDLTPTSVAFYIGPLFNAIARIGDAEEQRMLLTCLLDQSDGMMITSKKRGAFNEQVPYSQETLRVVTNAKSRQKRRQDKLASLIDAVVQEDSLLKNKILLVTIDDFDDEQRALSGLIANKLREEYTRPVLLVYQDAKGDYSGSVRAPDGIPAFENFREQCLASKLTEYSSGHSQAFGVKIKKENIQPFLDYFNKKFGDVDLAPVVPVDFCFSVEDDNFSQVPTLIHTLVEYKHLWGRGVDEPLIAITDAFVGHSSLNLLSPNKNPTLKIFLPENVEALKFKSSQEEYNCLLLPYNGAEQGYRATIVGRASLNEFRGQITPQLIVTNYEIHDIVTRF